MDLRTASGPLFDKLRRIRYSIASTGVRRGLSDLATHLLAYKPEQDASFDRRFATDTAGAVQPEQLGIRDVAAREQAILYLPSPARVTRWMLDQLGVEHADFTFVDLGCGKGRVLLVASEYPFRRIVGVEISPQLAAIARSNLDLYRPRARACQDVEVINTDATQLAFPDGNLWLHLYHPFEPVVTEAVLAQLEQALQRQPRRAVVAYLTYASAVEAVDEVFARFPRLKRVRHERSVLGQYDWIFYST
jgi:SAM-dependent methyltransferase